MIPVTAAVVFMFLCAAWGRRVTRDELLAALRDLPGDPEGDHYEADRLLLAYIGDDEVTAAFDAIRKWYA